MEISVLANEPLSCIFKHSAYMEHHSFGAVFVSVWHSWVKYSCSPMFTSYFLTLSVVGCCGGSVQFIYLSIFADNSCLLWLEARLITVNLLSVK